MKHNDKLWARKTGGWGWKGDCRSGAEGFFQKPFSVVALSEKVKEVLENNPHL